MNTENNSNTPGLVVVTGASRGIGLAIARDLAAHGYDLLLTHRDAPEAQSRRQADLMARAREAGFVDTQFIAVNCDLADDDAGDRIAKAVRESGLPLAGLVNNAGITRDGLAMRMSREQFEEVLTVDLTGPFLLCRALLPIMMRQRSGRIVNISSVVGIYGNAGQANYAAAKAGLIGLTRSLAREVASRGITVNAVAPGFIETDMTAAMPEKARAAVIDRIALGRLGQPGDIAHAVRFLLSDDASYITGQVLEVSGGLSI
ncbi:MAG: 3-oxoacyl-[acyl-carrier-protein] reductase [Bacillota bacterium]|nr:3-oxoacyl-[acyl-carrier-protein] reductase [Bacillota bacterium]